MDDAQHSLQRKLEQERRHLACRSCNSTPTTVNNSIYCLHLR